MNIRNPDWMTFFNKTFLSSKYKMVDTTLFPYAMTTDHTTYKIHPDNISHYYIEDQYSLDDIRPTDTVIDLGANIGAYSIYCCRHGARKVHAYEPLLYDVLVENIAVNKLYNCIIPHQDAHGNGDVSDVSWEGVTKKLPTKRIDKIFSECGGCDFLKVDTEGSEWLIRPDDVKDVRRIEIEFHMWSPYADVTKVNAYRQYFDITLKTTPKNIWLSGVNRRVC